MTALAALAAAIAAGVVLAATILVGARRHEAAIVAHIDARMAAIDAELADRVVFTHPSDAVIGRVTAVRDSTDPNGDECHDLVIDVGGNGEKALKVLRWHTPTTPGPGGYTETDR